MPRRDNASRRAAPSRDRYTILVYCGAVRTEPSYFDGLKGALRRRGLTVKVRQAGIDPEALVRAAAAYRDRRPGVYDEVWCVVDVDQFDIAAAIVSARRHGIRLAVSNPCFELWLLLHHDECRAYCAGYPEVARRLKKHLPMYDKADLNFVDFAAGVGAAIKRARDLEPTGQDHRRNPSTNVWQLVERIVVPDEL